VKKLTPLQLDALGENGNIAMGAAATALSQLLGQNVQITTPKLSNATLAEIRANYTIPCVLVRVNYKEGFQGTNLFILSDRDAGIIANMMMGDASLPVPAKLDEMYLSAVSEAMNQMMGSSATALSEIFQRKIDITPPVIEYIEDLHKTEIKDFGEQEEVVQIAFNFTVGEQINSTMLQVLPLDFAHTMVAELFGGFALSAERPVIPPPDTELITPPAAAAQEDTAAEFVQGEGKIPLELLHDIPVQLTGVLGRSRLRLEELMRLTAGTVIELDAAGSDEVEIVANGKVVAYGEIVLHKNNLAIRISRLQT
jgi:flagellar motor switch protein FliN/FliY